MNAPHHPNVEKLPDGADWRLVREEEARRFNEVYERTQAQWHKLARNEREANQQMADRFASAGNVLPTEVTKPDRTTAYVLLGCALALAACVCIAVSVLYFWR